MDKNINNELRIKYLMETHKSVSGEIQMRIEQRDKFAIQLITSLGAILTLGFVNIQYSAFMFFLIPLITLFFSIQILYSYEIHNRCHRFLTEEIEPLLGELLDFKYYDVNNYMWETYCKIEQQEKVIKSPGIRKKFFEMISLLVPSISSALFCIVAFEKEIFNPSIILLITIISFIIFQTLNTTLILSFNKKINIKLLNNMANLDYINKSISNDKSLKKVVFLDRDGTLHIDKVNTHKICDLEYFPDTIESLKKLQNLGYYLVIITNQDGIRRGLYSKKTMHEFNKKIVEDFEKNGIVISAIYYSPYCKSDQHYSFKPNPGMLIRAKYELNIDMEDSYLIGDQVTDIIAAFRAKIHPVMVTTGIYGKKSYKENEYYQDINPPTYTTLAECVKFIEDNN